MTMIKLDKTALRKLSEILLVILAVFLINFFLFPGNPGFFESYFNPYSAIVIMAAAYYGKFYGFIAFILTFAVVVIPVNREIPLSAYWSFIWKTQSIRLTIQLVGVYILGMIRDSYIDRIKHYQTITRKEVSEKLKFKNEAEALSAVNRELEERVLRQTEAVTSLYSQIKALHTQNLTETLNVLLQTVNKFTWAERASIWRYDQSSLKLVMIANIGWQAEDFENSILDVDETIEGWVYRNNMVFSVRMLLQYDNLMKMDKKRNILTFPISFSNQAWGVLNIEEMPFTKYNLYVEKIMSILVDLASPEIERAVEYESLVTFEEINPHTGLPAYTQFYNMIDKNIARAEVGKGNFSIVLIEFLNFGEIQGTYGDSNVWALIQNLMEHLSGLSGNKIDFFHYRETNQIALYYPDIDYDGVSMFCLETLGVINNTTWKIHDTAINIEAILGYSSFGHQVIPVEELFSVAENLLEMQKV